MTLKSAGFVIFRRKPDIEYLFLQASYGTHHWSPPKGQVDEGEAEFTTALREIGEEIGLVEDDLKIHRDVTKSVEYIERKGRQKIATFWLAELARDAPIRLSDEHLDYKWFNLEEACKVSEYMGLPSVLTDVHKYITTADI